MTEFEIPRGFDDALAKVHPEWLMPVMRGLRAVETSFPGYLRNLAEGSYLPTQNRIFAAFSRSPEEIRYVLIGEGPYPRAESATGYAFMDGAVDEIWLRDESGFTKAVNKATSLRNFLKMLCVTEGLLQANQTSGDVMASILPKANSTGIQLIRTLPELQNNLIEKGFLLLNASLVFRDDVPPAKDGKSWLPFLREILCHLQSTSSEPPVLVLWGKIASEINKIPEVMQIPRLVSEHPYNLSFIQNSLMQNFFKQFALLRQCD